MRQTASQQTDRISPYQLICLACVSSVFCICANNNKTDLTGPTLCVTKGYISWELWILFNYIMLHANCGSSLSIFSVICLCQKACFFPQEMKTVDSRHNCFIKIQKTQNMNKVGTWLVIKLGIIWQALEAYYHNGDVF